MTSAERHNLMMHRTFADARRLKAARDVECVAAFHVAIHPKGRGWVDLTESQQGTLLYLADQIRAESRGRQYNTPTGEG